MCQVAIGQISLDSIQHLKPIAIESRLEPDPVFTTTILDSTILQLGANLSLDEILKFQTNLYIRDYGSGALSTIAFRGYNSRHTAVLWEGMPISSSMNKSFDGALMPSILADDISIHYGAAGMINGAGGLGGTISFGTNPVFGKGDQLQLRQAISSINNASTGIKYVVSKKRFYSSTALNSSYGENVFSYENPNGKEVKTERMSGAGYEVFTGQQKLYWKTKRNTVFGWSNLVQLSKRNLPHTTFQQGVVESQGDNTINSSLSLLTYWKNVKIKANLGGRIVAQQYKNKGIGIADVGREQQLFAQLRFLYEPIKDLELENALIYSVASAEHPAYNGWQNQLDAQHIVRATYQYNSFLFHGLIKSQVIDDNVFPVLPSAGAKWNSKSKWLIVKSNAAYHAMAPSLNDLYWSVGGNPDLLPERGFTSEFTVLSERDTGFNYSFTGFWSSIEDCILWEPTSVGLWSASNISEVENTGFEAALMYFKPLTKTLLLNVRTNYTFNQALDSSGNQLAYLPAHRVAFNGSLAYKQLRISYSHRFNDRRYLNAENTAYLPSFFNAMLGLNYTFKMEKGTSLELGCFVHNLYNEPYQEIANRPMSNRFFNFSLKLSKS